MTDNAFDPLVEPGPPLSRDQLRRYARQLLLPGIGVDGQRRLAATRVLVIGAGGLGAPVIQYLAAAGVGTIGIVDDDTVELSNLQRQVLHGVGDIGRPKVDSAAETVAHLNPGVRIDVHPVRLRADNAVALLSGHHLVLDGADNFATRYLVADACEILGLPCVWGSILRFDGQVSVFWPGHGPLYRDLFPQPPDPALVPSCAEAGVFGALCGSIGSAMATEALKLITGVGRPLVGRLLVHDALAPSWREIPLAPDPNRRPVTDLAASESRAADTSAIGPSGTDRAASETPSARSPSTGAQSPSTGARSPSTGADASHGLRTEATGARSGQSTTPGPATITARELASLSDESGDGVVLVDVREPAEAAIDRLPAARLVPMHEILTGTTELPRDRPIILHCASGIRSARVAGYLLAHGYPDVRHLDGGLDAYRREFPD